MNKDTFNPAKIVEEVNGQLSPFQSFYSLESRITYLERKISILERQISRIKAETNRFLFVLGFILGCTLSFLILSILLR